MRVPQLTEFNLRLLRVLDMLLETHSVSRAAEALGVTPSAVSHSLKALRDILGDPLFVRSGASLRPTAFAVATQPALRSALLDLRHILEGVPSFDPRSSRRRFSLVLPDFLLPEVLAPVVRDLRSEAPDASVATWALGPRTHLALASGELDLVLTAGQAETFLSLDSGMMRARMYGYQFVCMVRRDHPVLRSGTWDAETYAGLPHIFVNLYGASRSLVDDAIEKVGLTRSHVLTMTEDGMVEAMVAETDLVATMSAAYARQALRRGRVAALELPFACPEGEAFLWWHSRFQQDPAHIWWRGQVTAAVRQAELDAPPCDVVRGTPRVA